jgi:predicted metal-dependent hydrolase
MAEDSLADKTKDEAKAPDIDHDNLQNLVNQLVKLPAEELPVEEEETPVVPRMTQDEIKQIKSIHVDPHLKVSFKERYATFLIKFLDELRVFLVPEARRTRCQLDGHECRHCGTKYYAAIQSEEEEEEEKYPRRR